MSGLHLNPDQTPFPISGTDSCVLWVEIYTTQGLTESQTQSSYVHVTDVQLGLHLGPLTTGAGPVSDSMTCLWILHPKLGCLIYPQQEKTYQVLLQLDVLRALISMGVLPFFEQKGSGNGERGGELERLGEGKGGETLVGM